MTRCTPGLSRKLAALWLFGISLGCVEAAVVYLRALYEPIENYDQLARIARDVGRALFAPRCRGRPR
jgi:hypothetical protein